ncbi:reverse transcriptase [Gossypium australe]|uniref:Reverse transcriptase n=1 Tax=Gossypium australe TaxID=47621 RepID=A0A5B6WEY2_9ROSI|nr:reverse transcriptase [Gossypium australe]
MAALHGQLWGVRINRYTPIFTHLLFVDDSMIFGEASLEGVNASKRVLDKYANNSGQVVNFDKFETFLSANVTQEKIMEVCQVLGVHSIDNLEKCLGLPSIVGKNKRGAFRGLKEKCMSRLNSWSSKALSIGGREVLIKSGARGNDGSVLVVEIGKNEGDALRLIKNPCSLSARLNRLPKHKFSRVESRHKSFYDLEKHLECKRFAEVEAKIEDWDGINGVYLGRASLRC